MTDRAMHDIFDGIRWVWFDLDDTLYDFRLNSHLSLAEVYEMAKLRRWWPDVDAWRDHYHYINTKLWELYAPGIIDRATLRRERFFKPLTEASCPDDTAEELWPELDRLYLGLLANKKATIPSAVETVIRLRNRGLRIGILSNGFKEVQYGKLASIGIAHLVDCTVLSDEIDINKPDRRIFDYACEKAGALPSQCLMVGDNPDTDIAGAIAASWRAIWFNPRGLPQTPALAEAVAASSSRWNTPVVISSLDEI